MESGFSSQQWDERDPLLHWTFGEYVDWAFKDAIQLFPEEIAFHDPWLVVAFKAAVESGCPLVADEVMSRCDLPPSTLQLALHAAVKSGDDGHREVLRLLLEKGVKEDANRPETLLHLAAERGRPLMVDLLLSHSQNVNARGFFIRTPLHVAIGEIPTSHKHEAAQMLIQEQSVDVEAEDKDGKTPLCYASQADCISCADSLLQRGAKVDGGAVPPLCQAAGVNNINTMRFLIQRGAALNAANKNGRTPLHVAVLNGRMEATQFLIFEGADIHLKTNNGDTPLDIAFKRKHKDIEEILQNHADSNAVFDKEKQLAHLQLMIELKIAAQRGSKEEVREILQRSTFSPAELKGAFLAAAEGESRGHTEVTEILLKNGAKDTQEGVGLTSLHYAAQGGNLESLDLLLSHFHDFNVRDFFGRTPLHLAVGGNPTNHKHEATQRLLEEESVDVEAEDKERSTPLCYASLADCISCADSLLQRGAKVDGGAVPPLLVAAGNNNTNILRMLLKNGAQVNKGHEDGSTALHLAAYLDQKESVQLLLLGGADVSIRDSYGNTAFDLAIQQGNEEIANILTTHIGFTSLHYAAQGGNLETLDHLLSHCQDFNIRDFSGRTPLHLAIGFNPSDHKHEATQRLLEEESVDVEAEDENGRTPLCYTSRADCISCADSLLQRGAKVDGGAVPPLLIAAEKNNINILRMLLKNGAQVNKANKYGATALHIAAYFGQKESVQLLLLGSADVSIRDSNGDTALDDAIQRGKEEIANILKTHKRSGRKKWFFWWRR